MGNYIPLYQQVSKLILEDIQNHTIIKPNNSLVPERLLASKYNVSRVTIRKAIKYLKRDNLIRSVQGKGNFYSSSKIIKPLNKSLGFTKVIEDVNKSSKTITISSKISVANEEVATILDLEKNRAVIEFERIRILDNEVVAFENSILTKNFSFLLNYDLNEYSMYEIIQSHNFSFTPSDRTIELIYANKYLSSMMNIKEGQPLILLKGTTTDRSNVKVHYAQEYLLADKFKFII